MAQTAAKVGDSAPATVACCNACRTCVTTNVLTLAAGLGMAAVYGVGRMFRRAPRPV